MTQPGRRFLLLTTREQDHLSDAERDSFLRLTGLAEDEVVQHRMERGPATVDPREWTGIVLGGSPYTVTDPPETKTDVQHRVEAELTALLRHVVAADTPFLGLCYGMGVAGIALGGVVDRTYAEPVGAAPIRLTDEGRTDPVFSRMPQVFHAFVGHKEACHAMPEGAVLLATNDACPVQAYRLGSAQYVTQFHPELEVETIIARIHAYADHGYFDPGEKDELIERVSGVDVSHAHGLLRAFVDVVSGD